MRHLHINTEETTIYSTYAELEHDNNGEDCPNGKLGNITKRSFPE